MPTDPLSDTTPQKLPLWRILAAGAVLFSMVAVLVALAPVYLEDWNLRQYMRSLARNPVSIRTGDDELKIQVVQRARSLRLPLRPQDVTVAHPQGRLELQTKYAVEMDFPLYQVDLHFHATASSR